MRRKEKWTRIYQYKLFGLKNGQKKTEEKLLESQKQAGHQVYQHSQTRSPRIRGKRETNEKSFGRNNGWKFSKLHKY